MARELKRPDRRYLEHSVNLKVRFNEVDPLRVVWHGHYPTYFEDARVEFGRRYGIGYEDLIAAGLAAPIVSLRCEYLAPARFGDELTVTVRLYESESARIDLYYDVRRSADGALLAVGTTVQVFSDHEGNMLMTMPDVMRQFYRQWSEAMVKDDA